ncbi:hypothetical protein [Amycolatopsis sp. PS_44_ISF1]|uniref:hypothetical protein n=1 Tax=Amycolatopsis sp. PS_44_ISF1 TaxID=2974917 RepID=UPI0028DE7D21|nr:hypothetical protein [Amycolatopsis sp. PS_44_ISF1]MDT8916186.1 hypothetical protein [Amycolatopsis sp. PS_44_ISF1]
MTTAGRGHHGPRPAFPPGDNVIRSILHYFIPAIGRRSAAEAVEFGRALDHGFGFITVGPLAILVDLPPFLRKAAEPVPREPSIADLNTAIRTAEAAQEAAAKTCPQS